MRKRFDYRNDYKGLNLEQLKTILSKLQDKLLDSLGICDSLSNDYLKRIIYVEKNIKKLEVLNLK